MKILINWILSTLAIMVVAYVLDGVSVDTVVAGLLTALVLVAVNTFIKPVILILTLPVNILSLGLFTFVINAFLILLISKFVPGFSVDGFFAALIFSILLTIINTILSLFKK